MVESGGVGFRTPKEPEDIKKKIMYARSQHKGYRRALIGIEVPSYLWSHWKGELKNRGYAWSEFLKLMKDVGETTSWAFGKLSWEDFVRKVVLSIEGAHPE